MRSKLRLRHSLLHERNKLKIKNIAKLLSENAERGDL